MKAVFRGAVLLLVLQTYGRAAPSSQGRRLMHHLLDTDRYDRRHIPSADNNLTSRVTMSLAVFVQQINELRDRTQELQWAGFVRAIWNDPLLTWKPDEWGGVKHIFVRESDIWVPDVAILERLDDDIGFKAQSRRLLYVNYRGDVKWPLGGDLVSTRCPLNIYKFPLTKIVVWYLMTCSMTVGSYSIPADEIELINTNDSSYDPIPPGNALWEVTSTESHIISNTWTNELGTTRFDYLYFTMHLKRKPAYFVVNMIVPLVLISGLMLMTFLLPPDGGEKISFGITLLLAFNVIQLVMTDTMPQTSSLPVITVYITVLFTLSAFLIPLAIISAYVHAYGTDKFPNCLRKLLSESTPQSPSVVGSYTNRSSDDLLNGKMTEPPQNKELNSAREPLRILLRQFYEESEMRKRRQMKKEQQIQDEGERGKAAKKIDFFFMKLYGLVLVLVTVACIFALIV